MQLFGKVGHLERDRHRRPAVMVGRGLTHTGLRHEEQVSVKDCWKFVQ